MTSPAPDDLAALVAESGPLPAARRSLPADTPAEVARGLDAAAAAVAAHRCAPHREIVLGGQLGELPIGSIVVSCLSTDDPTPVPGASPIVLLSRAKEPTDDPYVVLHHAPSELGTGQWVVTRADLARVPMGAELLCRGGRRRFRTFAAKHRPALGPTAWGPPDPAEDLTDLLPARVTAAEPG